jgi:hypothetical protein
MNLTVADLKTDILRDGFVIIPNLLSKEEVEKLRYLIKARMKSDPTYDGNQSHAACVMPELDWLFCHPKIISFMREITQSDKIMFTNHDAISCNMLSGWHKDDGIGIYGYGEIDGGYFRKLPYDLEDCKVYKVAIYLQDHHNNLGGLSVRRGSHRSANLDEGEEVYLKTKAGDAVIFDVRITHSGQIELVPIPWLIKPLRLLRRITIRLFRVDIGRRLGYLYNLLTTGYGDRLAIFITFGVANDLTITFSQTSIRRVLALQSADRDLPVFLPKNTRNKFLGSGVLLAEDHFSDLSPLPPLSS